MRWLPYRNFFPPFSTLRCDKQSVNNEQPPSLLLHFEKAHSTICERELIHHMSSPLRVIFLFHSVNYFACFGRIGERPTTINHARRAIAVFLRALKGGKIRQELYRHLPSFLPSVQRWQRWDNFYEKHLHSIPECFGNPEMERCFREIVWKRSYRERKSQIGGGSGDSGKPDKLQLIHRSWTRVRVVDTRCKAKMVALNAQLVGTKIC